MTLYPHEYLIGLLDNFFVKVLLLFIGATIAFVIGMSAIVYYIPYDNNTFLYTSDTQLTYNGCMSINPVFYMILIIVFVILVWEWMHKD